jgi:hypothetical protein
MGYLCGELLELSGAACGNRKLCSAEDGDCVISLDDLQSAVKIDSELDAFYGSIACVTSVSSSGTADIFLSASRVGRTPDQVQPTAGQLHALEAAQAVVGMGRANEWGGAGDGAGACAARKDPRVEEISVHCDYRLSIPSVIQPFYFS